MSFNIPPNSSVGFEISKEDYNNGNLNITIICPNCNQEVTIHLKPSLTEVMNLKCPNCLCQTGLSVGAKVIEDCRRSKLNLQKSMTAFVASAVSLGFAIASLFCPSYSFNLSVMSVTLIACVLIDHFVLRKK
jgi:hypothetical protein